MLSFSSKEFKLWFHARDFDKKDFFFSQVRDFEKIFFFEPQLEPIQEYPIAVPIEWPRGKQNNRWATALELSPWSPNSQADFAEGKTEALDIGLNRWF